MIWFNFFYIVCFVLWGFCCCFSCCVLVCAFKFVLLLSLFWFLFVLFFFFVISLVLVLERSPVFISMWVGVGWSYNQLLARKLTFLILEFYINRIGLLRLVYHFSLLICYPYSLKCGREVWTYLLFYKFQIFFTNLL